MSLILFHTRHPPPTDDRRTDESSADVRECTSFGDVACPGSADNNGSRCATDDEYCACGYHGPLCSECVNEYFLASDGCQLCRDTKAHLPTIFIGSGIFVVAGVIAGLCYANSSQEKIQTRPRLKAAIETLNQLYQTGQVKFFILLLMFQVVSQFSQVVASSGNGRYPEPARTFVQQLGLANFDMLAVVPVDCMYSNTNFCASECLTLRYNLVYRSD